MVSHLHPKPFAIPADDQEYLLHPYLANNLCFKIDLGPTVGHRFGAASALSRLYLCRGQGELVQLYTKIDHALLRVGFGYGALAGYAEVR